MAEKKIEQQAPPETNNVLCGNILWGCLIVVLLVALLIATCAPAGAQPCTSRPLPEVLDELRMQYEEAPMAELRTAGQNPVVFTITAQPGYGSWTIMATDMQGVTCVQAAGDLWYRPPPAKSEEMAP
jgi:hypothetical protein